MREAVHAKALLAALALAAAVAHAAPSVTLRQVAQNLPVPVELVNADDGSNRLFIVSQTGAIRILQNGAVLSTPFLDVSNLITATGEQGLLGLAFHPAYESNGAFYVFYTRKADGALTIARYLRGAANANVADAASGAVILTIPHPGNTNHNGGRLAFGPDGYLYIGTGDGGGGGDPDFNGQDRSVRLGKILRIAVDGGTGYSIPPSNPFAGSTCNAGMCPEIWAYGLRNPWKFSFDALNGDLFIGDVGQGNVEEVDWQLAASTGAVNYGWGVYEGNNCYNDTYFGSPGACAALTGHARPILSYGHDSSGGFSISGGYRYRGSNAALKGHYIYGDYVSRRIWAARPDRFGAWTTEVLLAPSASLTSIASFGEDESGELYVVDRDAGKIFAIDGPPLSAVFSRKTHAAAGDLDLAIDTSRAAGDFVTVEPRVGTSGGGSHLAVFQFSTPITSSGTVTCVNASGTPVGSAAASFSGNEVRVALSGIPANQRVQVRLAGVNGTINVSASMGFLVGDVDGSASVTASDILRVKGWSGLPTTASNFLYDVDLSSGINSLDIDAVKARAGLSL